MDQQTNELIKNEIENNEVCLFMKGTPDAPQCGFSMATSNILKILEVNFKGINIKKPKYLINEIEYLFAEDQGRYIIEINKKDFKKVADILNKNAVHFDELGTISENELYINDKTKVTIDELSARNKSWLTNYMSK